MSLDIYIDPVSGGYIKADNKIEYVNAIVNKVNVLLSMPVGSYIYAPTQGNPLLNLQGLIPISEIKNGILTCLSPLLTSGEISFLNFIDLEITPTFRYIIKLLLVLPNGEQPLVTWRK